MKLPNVTLGHFGVRFLDVTVAHMPMSDDVNVRAVLYPCASATDKREQAYPVILDEVVTREVACKKSVLREAIRTTVLRVLEHEVDEWLRVDGRRMRTPHPKRKAKSA